MGKKGNHEKGCIVLSGKRYAKRNSKKCPIKSSDGLQCRVLKLDIENKNGKRYLHFCNFGYHTSKALTPEICQSRECEDYHQLLISKATQVYPTK
tara:strand:- start:14938 stop:15222 length:285 start_codon:yes stop_codon:yes gene_type:complete